MTGYNFATLTTRRFSEVVVGHLQVVTPCDLLAISHRRTDDVRRENFSEFCLPTGPHVVPQLRPRRQVGTFDDLAELRVERLPWSETADEASLARFRLVPPFFEVRPQIEKHRDDARLFPCVVLGFRTIHPNASCVPVR